MAGQQVSRSNMLHSVTKGQFVWLAVQEFHWSEGCFPMFKRLRAQGLTGLNSGHARQRPLATHHNGCVEIRDVVLVLDQCGVPS